MGVRQWCAVGGWLVAVSLFAARTAPGPAAPDVAGVHRVSGVLRTSKQADVERPTASSTAAPHQRLVLLTGFFGAASGLTDTFLANKRAYASSHGLRLVDAYEEAPPGLKDRLRALGGGDQGSKGYVDKQLAKLAILRHYSEAWADEYDWIFWNDADSLFLNGSASLLPYCPTVGPKGGGPVLVVPAGPPRSKNWRGVMNTGHMFLATGDAAMRLLDSTLEIAMRPCDRRTPLFNGWLKLCKTHCCEWGDQGALMQALQLRPDLAPMVQYVGFREYGSLYPLYGAGDLVVHFAGLSTERRLELFAEFAAAFNFSDGSVRGLAIPPEIEPGHNPDHLRGISYALCSPVSCPHAPDGA